MKTDSQLQNDIMLELTWDPSVTHAHIGVAVTDGIVTLSGTVPTYTEKFAAEKATQRVAGVKGVVEKIEVKIPGSLQRTDEDLARAVLTSLKWHSQVPESSIKVSVANGRIELTGDVEWGFQKDAAQDAVKNLMGVTWVINNIAVKTRVSPTNVKEKIEQALKRAAEREAKHITVEVKGSKVILSGNVRSFVELRDARGAAWSAPGVTQVETNLRISA